MMQKGLPTSIQHVKNFDKPKSIVAENFAYVQFDPFYSKKNASNSFTSQLMSQYKDYVWTMQKYAKHMVTPEARFSEQIKSQDLPDSGPFSSH